MYKLFFNKKLPSLALLKRNNRPTFAIANRINRFSSLSILGNSFDPSANPSPENADSKVEQNSKNEGNMLKSNTEVPNSSTLTASSNELFKNELGNPSPGTESTKTQTESEQNKISSENAKNHSLHPESNLKFDSSNNETSLNQTKDPSSDSNTKNEFKASLFDENPEEKSNLDILSIRPGIKERAFEIKDMVYDNVLSRFVPTDKSNRNYDYSKPTDGAIVVEQLTKKLQNILSPNRNYDFLKITELYLQHDQEQDEPSRKYSKKYNQFSTKYSQNILSEIKDIISQMEKYNLNTNIQLLSLLFSVQVSINRIYDAFFTYKTLVNLRQLPNVSDTISLAKLAVRDNNKGIVFSLIRNQERFGVIPSQELYESLMKILHTHKEHEHTYLIYEKMISKNITPSKSTFHMLIYDLVADHEEELAYKVLKKAHSRAIFLNSTTYLLLLRSIAFKLMHKETVELWRKCNEMISAVILEGDCLLVLGVAARYSDSILAADVLRVLDQNGYSLAEYHLESLLESFAKPSTWERAIEIIHIMRSSGMGKSISSLSGFSKNIVNMDTENNIDLNNFYNLLVKNKDEYPLALDTVTLNALIKIFVDKKAVSYAISVAFNWFDECKIKRNEETYEILLEGCKAKKNTVAAKELFTFLQKEGIKPTQKIYELMIFVPLTHTNYEDAFIYLEAMKSNGFIPSAKVYASLALKCEKWSDPRYEAVIEEMKMYNYPIMFGYNRFKNYT
ncbi:hypothetical protein BB560_001752 [Smittium megazygosporum]|uniref:Uncharacterized protein n=1 Tax=Smittium megazygosporum TaxID=133381 RepID=A0A2T9Z7U6_9FUNG|nr:hypothetical protein BB560_004943 [Smittium megazygosporum]PVV03764.1 hypothetical protein BB560_001752 [Smittium megazygosporum]